MKSLQSGGFREGRSGYSKHNFFFSPYVFSYFPFGFEGRIWGLMKKTTTTKHWNMVMI